MDPSLTVFLNGDPIVVSKVEQLDHRATVYRLWLEPASDRPKILKEVSSIVVKQQKNDWDEEFSTEKNAYDRLEVLQGKVIPKLFGQSCFNGKPALFLSDVNGIPLQKLARDTKSNVQEEALKPKIEQAFKAFTDHGAVYYDPSLDNVICCVNEDSTNIKVVIVDLESVTFPDPIKPWESTINQGNANSLMEALTDIRQQNGDHSHASSKMTEPGDDSTWKMAQSSIHTQLASQNFEASCHIMV